MKALRSTCCMLALLGGVLQTGCGDDDDDGNGDGSADGSADGNGDGAADGNGDGAADGNGDGAADGNGDGAADGDGDGDGFDPDDYPLTGEISDVEGTASAAECTSTSDTRDEDGCYGFFCGSNSNSLNAALTEDSPCASVAQVWLICDGLGVREASRCAREHALDQDPREGTRMCLRENEELDPFTDECLACFLDSADCARENCLSDCLGGDSAQCDACRESAGCTPDYYACSGLPDPQ
jgi:hypothetical protein